MKKGITKIYNKILIPTLLLGLSFCISACNSTELINAAIRELNLDLNLKGESLTLKRHVKFSFHEEEYSFDINWLFEVPTLWKVNEDESNDDILVYQPVNIYKDFLFNVNIIISDANHSYSKCLSGTYQYNYNTIDSLDELIGYDKAEAIMIEGIAIDYYIENSFLFFDGESYIRVDNVNTNSLSNKKISLIAEVNKQNTDTGFSHISLNYLYHNTLSTEYYKSDNYEQISLSYLKSVQSDIAKVLQFNNKVVCVNGYLKENEGNYYISDNDINVLLTIDNHLANIMLIDLNNIYCEFIIFLDYFILDNIICYNFALLKIASL